jgi:isoquinoline 1-oxidoreductase alpha subunit
MMSFQVSINGVNHAIDADPRMPLLWVIRDRLGLTGTKYGCGAGLCGACTVLQDGRAVRSCTTPLSAAAGHAYTTIEGLAKDASHPCQAAWIAEDVAQCGFCQPGMILEAVALLRATPSPTDQDVDRAFGGHICRCGTYTKIRRAIARAAEARR